MSKRVYYDALGKELKVGSYVAVPNWGDQAVYFGVVKKLNFYNSRDDSELHRIVYYINGEKWHGNWRGSSIMTLSDSDAIMLKLRNFEPVRE